MVTPGRSVLVLPLLLAACASEPGGKDSGSAGTDADDGGPGVVDASAAQKDADAAPSIDATGDDIGEDAGDAMSGVDATVTDAGGDFDADGGGDASGTDGASDARDETDGPATGDTEVDGAGSDGCDAGGCPRISPSNLPPDICDAPGTTTFDATINMIETGTDCDLVVTKDGGPDICVLKFASVVNFGSLTVTGRNALAIVATDSMRLAGTIDASGVFATPGPGAPDSLGAGTDAQGSGAGHAVTGGAGPDTVRTSPPFSSPGSQPGAPGGAAYGSPYGIPLLGGATGGAGGGSNVSVPNSMVPYGVAGAGGGALQLVSCGPLTIPASPSSVTVSGGAGRGGRGTGATIAGSGGGGGSGGTLLIEAPQVTVEPGASGRAQLWALGGGGGGGGGYQRDGLDGSGAAGGGGAPNAGQGGSSTVAGPQQGGPFLESLQQPGDPSSPVFSFGGGGGGGAVGVIRINVVRPSAFDTAAFAGSPPVTVGVVGTH